MSAPSREQGASLLGHIRTRMFRGLAVLVPLVVTLFVLRLLLGFMAGLMSPIFGRAFETWPWLLREAIAVSVLVVGLYVIGEITTLVVARKLLGLGETLLLRVPFVKVIYRAAKQVVEAFQTPRAKQFKGVVAVRFPHADMYSLGFLTGTVSGRDGESFKTVFVPTTPNPTTGFLQIVPESQVTPLEITVEEAIRTIMSLGLLVPPGLADMIRRPAPEGSMDLPTDPDASNP